jgi:CheY-like chemotaxis protein
MSQQGTSPQLVEPTVLVTPTVLVADDSAVLRGLLTAILESGGYRVLLASNGLAAMLAVRTSRPDAVLMDIEMPTMSGLDACAHLKADPLTADVPVVMISTRIPDGVLDCDAELWATADAYLSKPVRRETLLACLDRLLGISRADGW